MAKKILAGAYVEVNDEGYMIDSSVWNLDIARAIAREEGVALTEKHIQVLEHIRNKHLKGEELTLRGIGKSGLVDIKGFYELFPGAPMKKASKIAGIPKPVSCV